jgi:hypothetical protein
MWVPPPLRIAVVLLGLALPSAGQAPPRPAPPRATPAGAAPPAAAVPTTPTRVPVGVEGYVANLDIETTLTGIKDGPSSPEAQAFLGQLRANGRLQTRIYLTQDLSRQEVVSTDFFLPAGTVILHQAGAKFYVIADPKAKTYVVMDAEGVLKALEGGIGIVNSEYTAKVQHGSEKKQVGPATARRSVVTVGYVSAIPFENDQVMVQQTNEIEVWHTSDYLSRALLDHFFFKFQRDKTGTVQRVVTAELGFPLEMSMTISHGGGGKKPAAAAGSLRMAISEVRSDKRLDPALFDIPPAGYKKADRSPFGSAARP